MASQTKQENNKVGVPLFEDNLLEINFILKQSMDPFPCSIDKKFHK